LAVGRGLTPTLTNRCTGTMRSLRPLPIHPGAQDIIGCHKAWLPLFRVSGRPSVRKIRRITKPEAEDQPSLRAKRLACVLGASLGNGLGLVLWWQAEHIGQPGVSQLCWWPLVVAVIGPLISYVMLMLEQPGCLLCIDKSRKLPGDQAPNLASRHRARRSGIWQHTSPD
jgi:hypothetical protein